MTVFYFTSTGNSLEAAKKLSGKAVSIPSVLKRSEFTFEDDIIGIITPNYQGDLPAPVKEFLSKVNFKAKYIFGIITYGFFNAATNFKLEALGKTHGIHFNYINSLLMVDNSFLYFEMEKEIKKLPKKKVDEHIKVIKNDVLARKQKVNGNDFAIKGLAKIIEKISAGNSEDFSKNFEIDSSCFNCGICEKVCPINNIVIKDKPIINDKCIRCGACWHNCPQKAIHYKGEKSKTQYRNANVTVQEIIKANS